MRTWIGLAVATTAAATALLPAAAQDTIEWRTDLEGAKAEAERTGKPMLVVFR